MAYTFNGSNRASSTAAIAGPTNFSASLWFRSTSIGTNQYPFMSAPASGPSQDYLALIGGNSSWCGSYKTSGAAAQSSASAASNNVWYHLCGYWRSTARRSVFAHNDGVRYDNTTTITTDSPGITVWGNSIWNGAFGTDGLIGELAHVGLWNTELSDAEFASLRAGVSPMRIRIAALVDYWPLIRTVNGVKGNVLTLGGGVTPTASGEMPRIYY